MQLIKGVFLAGLLLTLVSAGAFAAYNRGVFGKLNLPDIDPIAFFEESVVPNLPPQIANALPKSNKDSSSSDTPSSISSASASTNTSLAFSSEEATLQLQTLTERGQEVSNQIGKVLGDFVQVNENNQDQALQDKAFEYGQYLYCQQVIKDYETKQNLL